MNLPTAAEMEAFIRAQAVALGIDPDVAVKVARSEGLQEGTWQSNLQQPYGREASYGPFQMHLAPPGRRPGMGNDFMKDTGLNPADPSTWKQGVTYALGQAKKGGWGPWMGAKKVGVTGKMGIDGAAAPKPEVPSMGASLGGFATGPGDVQARMDTGQVAGLLDDKPAPFGGMGVGDISSLGLDIYKSAKKKKQDELDAIEPPQAQVLMPINRYTLKGLLG